MICVNRYKCEVIQQESENMVGMNGKQAGYVLCFYLGRNKLLELLQQASPRVRIASLFRGGRSARFVTNPSHENVRGVCINIRGFVGASRVA